MKKAHILGVLFILLVTFATGAAAQTAVVTSTVVVVPPGTVTDVCTNEDVAYSGTIEVVMDVWVDANGNTHLRTKTPQVNVTGVGLTTGNDYRVQSGGQIVENTTAEGRPWESSTVIRMGLIGAGPAPNERVLVMFHQTVNADGNTTAEIDQYVGKCNGK